MIWISTTRPANHPWESPQHDLAEARRLIEKHSYWRRKEELEDAEEGRLRTARSLAPAKIDRSEDPGHPNLRQHRIPPARDRTDRLPSTPSRGEACARATIRA